MSAICTEFVQNAWKKDLCSNCFKARADHSSPSPADPRVPQDSKSSHGQEEEKPLGTTPKKTPNENYASSKQTIMEMHKSMVASVASKGLTSLNHKNSAINNNNNNNSKNNNNVTNGVSSNRFAKNRQENSSLRKIGSSGVHLWEVGHMPDKGDPSATVGLTNGVNGKEAAAKGDPTDGQVMSGILKDAKPAKNALEPRRGSVVGFLDGSPKVIGYGGDDYDWGDDQESSEEPSDVDSLENYDLTEEDRAFSQLTDRNTEYNADNTNLLLSQPVHQSSSSVFPSKGSSSLVDRLTPQSFYSMPASKRPPTRISSPDKVQSFIETNMLNGREEPAATFLDDGDSEEEEDDDDGTMIVKAVSGTCPSSHGRHGCETIPSRKYPSAPRASVQQLFNEEPVTAAELQAASKKVLRPSCAAMPKEDPPQKVREPFQVTPPRPAAVGEVDDMDGECSPYGVTRIADIAEEDAVCPPVIPACPPPSSDDETQKLPVHPKSGNAPTLVAGKPPAGNLPSAKAGAVHQNLAHDQKLSATPLALTCREETGAAQSKSMVGICSTFRTPSPRDADCKFRNREYAAVNYSCHYASSYIKTAAAAGPTMSTADRTLPPTPLTNPYSSTAILKGIPRQQSCSPEQSPQKPPVTRPKPKLLAKPHASPKVPEGGLLALGLEQAKDDSPAKTSSAAGVELASATRAVDAGRENEDGDTGLTSSVASSSSAAGVDEQASTEASSDQQRLRTSYDSRAVVATASPSSLPDVNKRGPKRQAPRPPTTSQDSPPSKGDDRASVTSLVSSDFSQVSPTRSTPHPTPDHHHYPLSSTGASSSPNVAAVSAMYDSAQTPVSTTLTTVHHSPAPANVMTTSTPNLPSYESLTNFKGSSLPKDKTKKSRFSLKKLLKFGSKEDHEDSKWKSKGFQHGDSHHHERRTKLEILHPIDLINGTRNDLPQSTSMDNKSSTGTSSSSKTSSIDSHQGLQMLADELQRRLDGTADTGTSQGSPSNLMDEQSTPGRCKPPPPLRSRSSSQDDPSKDKPLRPPPPNKRTHPLTKGQGLSDSLEDIHDSSGTCRSKAKSSSSLQNGDKRNSCYSTGMEYANLGDIRNNLAPKKPGRCVSSSMMDIAYTEQDLLTSAHRSSSNEDIYKMKENNFPEAAIEKIEEVTYYEPPRDQLIEEAQSSDANDLYADQYSITTDQSEPLSTRPKPSIVESLDSIRSIGLMGETNWTSNENQPMGNVENFDSSNKVYERVVLKRGNLEKVYAKFPVVADSSSVVSTTVSEVEDPISSDMGAVFWPRRKSSRLSLRKAKTVVHKNLEDNYGAVVSANHQTLTQILEQVSITQHTAASKIKLLEEVPPHWSDFKLLEDSQVTMVGDKAFYSAVWQQNVELTLMASQEPLCAASQSTRNPCVLVPIVEFEDAIPIGLFSKPSVSSEEEFCHGTVWVMERMRVETIHSVAESLHLQSQTDMEAYEREVCFVLLQLINALKHLQVLGIEEVDTDCSDFILVVKSNDTNYRLVILPKPSSVSDGYRVPSVATQEKLSLCRHALAVMRLLFDMESPIARMRPDVGKPEIPARIPSSDAFRLISDILQQERATSLSQAKLLLEYLLWGPTDLNSEGRAGSCGNAPTDPSDQELAYQRWLDLERATVLNNLIRTQSLWQIRLTVFEEYMLSFLVRTCAKTLREAAHQLQANQTKSP